MYELIDGKCWQTIDYVKNPFRIEVCPNCKDVDIYYSDNGKIEKYPFCPWCGYDLQKEYYKEL